MYENSLVGLMNFLDKVIGDVEVLTNILFLVIPHRNSQIIEMSRVMCLKFKPNSNNMLNVEIREKFFVRSHQLITDIQAIHNFLDVTVVESGRFGVIVGFGRRVGSCGSYFLIG